MKKLTRKGFDDLLREELEFTSGDEVLVRDLRMADVLPYVDPGDPPVMGRVSFEDDDYVAVDFDNDRNIYDKSDENVEIVRAQSGAQPEDYAQTADEEAEGVMSESFDGRESSADRRQIEIIVAKLKRNVAAIHATVPEDESGERAEAYLERVIAFIDSGDPLAEALVVGKSRCTVDDRGIRCSSEKDESFDGKESTSMDGGRYWRVKTESGQVLKQWARSPKEAVKKAKEGLRKMGKAFDVGMSAEPMPV